MTSQTVRVGFEGCCGRCIGLFVPTIHLPNSSDLVDNTPGGINCGSCLFNWKRNR